MIAFSNFEHFVDTQRFAAKIDKLYSLFECFRRVTGLVREDENVAIYKDFAPFSFEFVITNVLTNQVRMNGGIIYHGPKEDGTQSDPLSIQVSPSDGWSIHT